MRQIKPEITSKWPAKVRDLASRSGKILVMIRQDAGRPAEKNMPMGILFRLDDGYFVDPFDKTITVDDEDLVPTARKDVPHGGHGTLSNE
jgi:hypothetical protein